MAMEAQRLRSLELRLRELLGEEHARTLMENLPGADIVTKLDLGALEERMDSRSETLEERFDSRFEAFEERIDSRFEAFEVRIDLRFKAHEERTDLKLESLENRLLATFRSEVVHQTRTFFIGMVGSMATIGALAVTAAKLG